MATSPDAGPSPGQEGTPRAGAGPRRGPGVVALLTRGLLAAVPRQGAHRLRQLRGGRDRVPGHHTDQRRRPGHQLQGPFGVGGVRDGCLPVGHKNRECRLWPLGTGGAPRTQTCQRLEQRHRGAGLPGLEEGGAGTSRSGQAGVGLRKEDTWGRQTPGDVARTPTPPERVVTEQWPGAPLRARGPTAPSAPLKPQHLQTTEGCLQGARCPSREGHAGVPRVSRNGLTAPRGTHRPAQYPAATGAGDGVGDSAFSSRHVALSTLLRGLGKGLDWAPLGRGGVAVPGHQASRWRWRSLAPVWTSCCGRGQGAHGMVGDAGARSGLTGGT